MTKRLVVLSAGLSKPSSSRLLADRLSGSTVNALTAEGDSAEVTVIELREIAHDIVNNLLTGFPSPALRAVLDTVTDADGLIAVTPIFTTSYSGLFKSFLDVLDPDSLVDLPVLLAATGGTERHSLALEYAVRPLFSYLRAATMPTTVYAASADWGSSGTNLAIRIDRAGGELAAAMRASSRSARDPWALDTSFEQLSRPA
jgi:FMN reductase